MNVACPECKSVFRVDPAKVPEAGVRARCSVCGGVIGIGKRGAIDEDFAPALRVRTPESVPAAPGRPRTPVRPIAVPEPAGVGATPSHYPSTSGADAARVAPPSSTLPPRVAPPSSAASVTPTAVQAPGAPPATPAQNAHGTPATSLGGLAGGSTRPLTGSTGSVLPAPGAAGPGKPPAPPAGGSASAGGAPVAAAADVAMRRGALGSAPGAAPPINRAPVPPAVGVTARVVPAAVPPSGSPAARRPINPFLNNDPNVKARRLARALVSDLTAYYPDKRREGLATGRLKELFKEEIKKSWEEYVEQVGKDFAENTSHFRDALNEILAGGAKVF